MQYLVRTLTDSTGYTFTETIKARENETFTVVDAESKEEVEEYLYCEKLERTVNK
ncbi:DUF1381 domain-containing protein [Staphylococcus succinus]|uniref:DUF1381 domain-containing protein n=1 Tax=Staphylococcus succinus TaxID=61015 RepID=UPI0024819619|nr:DUF1381 domain-containing protein [Staphylococcus succinus]MDH9161287.1 DUF1381 domain-containing protein [Staphylococcus succinus]